MNASRRKTCSDDTYTNFSAADPVPAESSTSLDEIQQNFLVVQLIGHLSSCTGDRDVRDIMSTNCCSVESNKIPNQIAVWTEGSWRSSCSTPNWTQCTMTSCRELSMIEGSKIPNLISLDKLTDRSSCATPSGHADFCVLAARQGATIGGRSVFSSRKDLLHGRFHTCKTQPNPPQRPWIRPADGLEDAREISQPAHEQREPLECATPWQLHQRGVVSCQTHCPNRCAPGQSSSQLQGLQHVPPVPSR